eukprot:CAMPEP_0168349846 /NCGR_PEP_ID=MMETSP0213-20121227/20700_1 /TAXON_ID=151035 /ORGANISM="Euplotes harpa, Strain FSP1.4" /LENGTH=157 /DNA_ID=CAMNT_0008359947 /DNA_START=260 /DNA_END=733 /DNA_ORIENTATION=-
MLDVLVGLPQKDGSLSNTAKLRVNLILNPIVTSISPVKGFSGQMQEIRITGSTFYNFDSLHVKAVMKGSTDFLLDCLSLSNEVVMITSPNALDIHLYNYRKMYLYVSTNGVDYSEQSVFYTFMDEPHITELTDYDADYQGNIEIGVIGMHLTADVTH